MNLYRNLDEYRHSTAQAAALSRVPEKSLRNWMARGVVSVGRRHFLGRYEFSTLDVLRLAIVQVLQEHVAISLEESASVAEALIPAIRGTSWPGDWLLLARSADDGSWLAGWRDTPGSNPPGLNRAPHLCIPIGAIVGDVCQAAGLTTPNLTPSEDQ